MDHLKSTSAAYRGYHAIARSWASDVEFFSIESAFLHRLLDGYFIQLSSSPQTEGLKKVADELSRLEKQKEGADLLLIRHIKELEGQTADFVFARSEFISGNHDELEKVMNKISSEYKRVKIKIFQLVESVITPDLGA